MSRASRYEVTPTCLWTRRSAALHQLAVQCQRGSMDLPFSSLWRPREHARQATLAALHGCPLERWRHVEKIAHCYLQPFPVL